MKNLKLPAVLLALFISAAAVAADGPCKPKREAKKASHEALHECIKSWAKDIKPADADPSEDCSGKLSAFISAAKDVKACFAENSKKK